MTRDRQLIRTRLGVLKLASELGSVSQACRAMGYSRDSFYRFKQLYEKGGELALQKLSPQRRQPPSKRHIAPAIETAAVDLAIEQPTWGQTRVADALKQRGLTVSPFGVRRIWKSHNIENTQKRLKMLEARQSETPSALSSVQAEALEKAKAGKEANGKFESECPGYCIAQDTFYVGTLKGIGRIYQQTVLDTYSKLAFAKLSDRNTPATATEILNARVVPFFDRHAVPISRTLTDRANEYCGMAKDHEYEIFLSTNNIEHLQTQLKNPRRNGICERFHKIIIKEFYRTVFQKNAYETIAQLQSDLDCWITEYNETRIQRGRWCYKKTPMQAFLDTVPIAQSQFVAAA